MTSSKTELSGRMRWLILGVIAVLALGFAAVYAYQSLQAYQDRTSGDSAAEVIQSLPGGQRIVFRNTASGAGYGMIAAVALDDPAGPRELGSVACDRVDAAAGVISCMRTIRGVPTSFQTQILDATGRPGESWPLPGIPSRTRVSEGGLVATTAFVTGHSYAAGAFSTQTTVRSVDGTDHGNLEDFRMLIDGREMTAVDRNVWGVSFGSEDEFYATVASGGQTWLVHGNLAERTLTSVASNAECPSVSPDRTRVAYKKRSSRMGVVHWDIAVRDLNTGRETVIPLENGFDDQLEWLDDDTLLFGSPRPEAPGDSDVYAIQAAANATPTLFIEHAWSPSVDRTAG